MKLTKGLIERPVLSTCISLLIFVIGLAAYFLLAVQQYPTVVSSAVIVTTAYPGATAATIQALITRPLSQAIGSADGVDYMTSSTVAGQSTITAFIRLNYPPAAALTNISTEVNSVLYLMPSGSITPILNEESANAFPLMFINFSSDSMNARQISAYINNVVMPDMYSVPGISQLSLWGGQTYAMRIWLNPERMRALKVTPTMVYSALQNNNVQAAPGQLEGTEAYININAYTGTHTPEQFDNLVVSNSGDQLIRIKDIGYAALGNQAVNSGATFNGKNSVFLTIQATPEANPLTVINGVYQLLPSIKNALPNDLQATIAYDATTFIRDSIKEVMITIFEAIAIVVAVIFLFLGNLRSVLIPVVTIPLSLIGVGFLMLAFGYSINLLTLLAMVLAIGLVVDDAIVVLENIYRHLEEGKSPIQAAILGVKEIAVPIIVMTLTLAAVYAPIAFIGGVTGSLFTEFAFTLAFAVIISGVIALSFSPMLCSKLLTEKTLHLPFVKTIDKLFDKLKQVYQTRLDASLNYRYFTLCFAVVILISCYFLYSMTPTELAPQEDQGFLGVSTLAPPTANLAYLQKSGSQAEKIIAGFPETAANYVVYGFPQINAFSAGMVLKPTDQRDKSQMQLVPLLQAKVAAIPGVQAKVFQRPILPGTPFGPAVNFVLTSTESYQSLYNTMMKIQNAAQKSGLFSFIVGDLTFNNPQLNIDINRPKAATMGINMQTVSSALDLLTGGGLVNYFQWHGYSFQVIPQAMQEYRSNRDNIANFTIQTANGQQAPLSTIVSFSTSVEPAELNQFQQLNSATLVGNPAPSVTLGTALAYLTSITQQLAPKDVSINYGAASRQFIQEGQSIMVAFGVAIIIIFLLLAGKFESFRDPWIIMITVPMSIFGALIPLFLGLGTINIYTQIGLVTLIGLITKHGILMVDFANQLQINENLAPRAAIVKAASIRLRPILMTTAAMVFGVVPLIFAVGAGNVSRHDLGYVIGSGMSIGTCFTLFVVPAMYLFLSKPKKTISKID